MKLIEFNFDMMDDVNQDFKACIQLMGEAQRDIESAIKELSVSGHPMVASERNALVRLKEESEVIKNTLTNLKNVLGYAGDMYRQTETTYQKQINRNWEVVADSLLPTNVTELSSLGAKAVANKFMSPDYKIWFDKVINTGNEYVKYALSYLANLSNASIESQLHLKTIDKMIEEDLPFGKNEKDILKFLAKGLQLEDNKAKVTALAEWGRDGIALLSVVLLLADAKYVSQLTFDKEDDYAYNKQVHSLVNGILDNIKATGNEVITDLNDYSKVPKTAEEKALRETAQSQSMASGIPANVYYAILKQTMKAVEIINSKIEADYQQNKSNGYTRLDSMKKMSLKAAIDIVVSIFTGGSAGLGKNALKAGGKEVLEETAENIGKPILKRGLFGNGKPLRGWFKNKPQVDTLEKMDDLDELVVSELNLRGSVEGAGKVSIDALKDADKWLKALSTDELTALRRYQTGTYETINKSLREGTHLSDEMLSQVKNIDSAIGKGILGQDEIFYRGFTQKDLINKWDYLVNGGTFKFTDDAFVSTSKVQSKAVEFAKNSGSDGIVATVRVKKGENIANIDALKTPFFEDEAEILLGRGNKFSVVKAWVENGIKRVILEVN